MPTIGRLETIAVDVGGHTYRLLEGGEQSGKHGFWLWCSAVVLARLVACMDLSGKTVLDLGCGLGLVGLVAARRGARVTLCDPTTAERATHNLALNGLGAAVFSGGWADLGGHFDFGCASDVFFRDTEAWAVLTSCCKHVVAVDGMDRLALAATKATLPEKNYECFVWEAPAPTATAKP